jgi:hypothetical protein
MGAVRRGDFDFPLPRELIARHQRPPAVTFLNGTNSDISIWWTQNRNAA